MIPKFRAWHKELKVYAEKIYLIDFEGKFVVVHHNGEPEVWDFDEIILEQYTSLNDKNGDEIYDGDILQDEDGYLWVVSYSKEDAMFQLSDGTVAENFGNVSSTWFMIVGNVNENKELENE